MIAPGFRRASASPALPRMAAASATRLRERTVACPLPDGRYVLPDLRVVSPGPGGAIAGYRTVRVFSDKSILVEEV